MRSTLLHSPFGVAKKFPIARSFEGQSPRRSSKWTHFERRRAPPFHPGAQRLPPIPPTTPARSMPPAHRPGSYSFCQGNEGFRSPRKRGGFTPSLRICRPFHGLKACRAAGAGNFPNVQFEIRCRAFCATNLHFLHVAHQSNEKSGNYGFMRRASAAALSPWLAALRKYMSARCSSLGTPRPWR